MRQSPTQQPHARTGGVRLYLAAAPGGDADLVAAILERWHGFTRCPLPAAAADGPCAGTSAVRAARLGHAAKAPRRIVVDGVACAAEAEFLRRHGFAGVAVASTRAALVCAVGGAATWRAASVRQPARTLREPRCGDGAPTVDYLLDTGRERQLAREHVGVLVAVVETLLAADGPTAVTLG